MIEGDCLYRRKRRGENFIGREGSSGKVRVGSEHWRLREGGAENWEWREGGRGKKKEGSEKRVAEDCVKCSLTWSLAIPAS